MTLAKLIHAMYDVTTYLVLSRSINNNHLCFYFYFPLTLLYILVEIKRSFQATLTIFFYDNSEFFRGKNFLGEQVLIEQFHPILKKDTRNTIWGLSNM